MLKSKNNRKIGSHYEQQVAAFLQQKGFEILELNYRCRCGEIDIIARDGNYLVFVEVKYRKSSNAGNALEAIDARKAAQVRRVAQMYLYQKHYSENTPCRFDAAGVNGTTISYIKNAF